MTGVPVSAEGPSHPSPESPSSLLERAADLIENLACGATAGPWRAHDTHLVHGGSTATILSGDRNDLGLKDTKLVAWLPAFSTEPWNDRTPVWVNAQWVSLMSPSVSTPLVAWLRAESRFVRRNIKHMHGDVEHLPSMRFARTVLGEEAS